MINNISKSTQLSTHSDYFNHCAKYALQDKNTKDYRILPCNSWSCPICSKRKLSELKKRFRQSDAIKWTNFTHVSLTVSDADNSDKISSLLNDFFNDVRRTLGFKSLKYLWVKELQPERIKKYGGSWKSIHCIVNFHISKYDIIPIWNRLNKTRFNMIECTYPRSLNGGNYLLKYFTKSDFQELFISGERRYGFSKGVLPVDKRPESLFTSSFVFVSISEARIEKREFKPVKLTDYELLCQGYFIEDISISELNSLRM